MDGSYGSIEEYPLYCIHNHSTDYVSFYDENGNNILTIPDTIDNNLLDAINRLYNYYNNEGVNIEYMTHEEYLKIK